MHSDKLHTRVYQRPIRDVRAQRAVWRVSQQIRCFGRSSGKQLCIWVRDSVMYVSRRDIRIREQRMRTDMSDRGIYGRDGHDTTHRQSLRYHLCARLYPMVTPTARKFGRFLYKNLLHYIGWVCIIQTVNITTGD